MLRHVRGSSRFSGDIDATRTNPAKHKLDASDVADVMRRATDEPMLRIDPGDSHSTLPSVDAEPTLSALRLTYRGDPMMRKPTTLRSCGPFRPSLRPPGFG